MRIALRATRATLALFAPSLDAAHVVRFDGELQTLCRAFGVARDWDVFCLETLPAAQRALPTARLFDVAHVAEIARSKSHGQIDEIICGPRLTTVLLALASWAEQKSDNTAGTPMTAGDSLAKLAPRLLGRVACKTRRRGRHVTRLPPDRLHRFRKALDRLCDDSNMLAALFPHHRVSAYRSRCVVLQDLLGTANDAVVAGALSKRLLVEARPDLLAPVAALLAWVEVRRGAALVGLRSATRQFRDSEPFWT